MPGTEFVYSGLTLSFGPTVTQHGIRTKPMSADVGMKDIAMQVPT